VEPRSLSVPSPELAADSLGFFRWGRIAGRVLVTTDAGDWAYLSEAEFGDLLAARVTAGHPRFEEFQRMGLVRDGLDLDALATRIAQRNRHVARGPHVHVVTLSRRAAAAEASANAGDDLDVATAEAIVDLALQVTAPAITFELQAADGEPLRHFDVLRHLVETAVTRNARATGKDLRFRLISNCSAMTEATAEWLIGRDVLLTTTLDGPAYLHDATRRWLPGSPHADVVGWIDYFTRRYAELGRDPQQWHVDALCNVTRQTLGARRALLDEYVARGLRMLHLRPLAAARVDAETWRTIGYGLEEYLDFYRHALDDIVALNRRGVDLRESLATIILTKILTADDPGIVDLQSPYGAGTGQIAYDVDGQVYPCDEARAVAAAGDPLFALGQAQAVKIADLVQHPTVRAIATASLLDVQPMCAECWNKPYCGFSPVRSYIAQGDLFGQRPHCAECKEHLAISTRLFELLGDEQDPETVAVLTRWPSVRSPHATNGRAYRDAP